MTLPKVGLSPFPFEIHICLATKVKRAVVKGPNVGGIPTLTHDRPHAVVNFRLQKYREPWWKTIQRMP